MMTASVAIFIICLFLGEYHSALVSETLWPLMSHSNASTQRQMLNCWDTKLMKHDVVCMCWGMESENWWPKLSRKSGRLEKATG